MTKSKTTISAKPTHKIDLQQAKENNTKNSKPFFLTQEELGDRNLGILVFLTILSPILGYMYTRRIVQMLCFYGAFFSILATSSFFLPTTAYSSKRNQMAIAVAVTCLATAENSRAVLKARR